MTPRFRPLDHARSHSRAYNFIDYTRLFVTVEYIKRICTTCFAGLHERIVSDDSIDAEFDARFIYISLRITAPTRYFIRYALKKVLVSATKQIW